MYRHLICSTLPLTDAFSSQEGDIGGAAVITYVLWAIFDHQKKSAFIHCSSTDSRPHLSSQLVDPSFDSLLVGSALGFAIISSFWTLKAFVYTWRSSGGELLSPPLTS